MKRKYGIKRNYLVLFVSVLAVGTFAAAMSEHVTQLVLMMELTKLIQTLLSFISQMVSQLVSSVKRMTFMLPL